MGLFAFDKKKNSVFTIIFLFAATFVFLLVNTSSAEEKTDEQTGILKPTLQDGQIVCGSDKRIWQKYMRPPYNLLTIMLQGKDICCGLEYMNFGLGEIAPLFFTNREEYFSGNTTTYSADVRASTASAEKLGTCKITLTYLENGMAKVESRLKLDDPSMLKFRTYQIIFPGYLPLKGFYVLDGKKVFFDKTISKTFDANVLKGFKITYFPDRPAMRFIIQPERCSKVVCTGKTLGFFPDSDGVISFLIDISGGKVDDSSEITPNGINTWSADKLHLPDYKASPNLVQNPSFEAGLRYWAYRTFADSAIPLKYGNFYDLDTMVAHSGRNSLRIKALSISNPLPLGIYPLPFIIGEKYTLSFYAKGSLNKNIMLAIQSRSGQKGPQKFTTSPDFELQDEWKRYTLSFTAVDNFITFYFLARLTNTSQGTEGFAWIDDVQVEKGDVSNFKQSPCSIQLLSSARGNFLEYGSKPDFRLFIQTRPDTHGTVCLDVEDFFSRIIFKKEFKFKTDASGIASIMLSALDGKVMDEKLRGVFCVNATLKMQGDSREYKDYFRFSVMNFLENKHKTKNIFSVNFVYTQQSGGPDFERYLERLRAIGIGSVHGDFVSWGKHVDYDCEKERIEIMKRYGIDQIGKVAVDFFSKNSQIEDKKSGLAMMDLKNMTNPTEQQLAEFERICEMKAKNRPWFDLWWFTAESKGYQPLESHPEAFAKFLIATMRGIKRGNPNAKVLVEGGPWTIAPLQGIKWMERYIQDIKKIDPSAISGFDGVGGHFYCSVPESYDLDKNIDEFINMLKKNGCENFPLYLGEGFNYSPMHLPSLGISPYLIHTMSSWYMSPISYHMGLAERISAAYTARTWLVGLKYQDRVKQMTDLNGHTRMQDIDFSPRPYDKVVNTLGRILGDASFYRDIRFSPFSRCYVFQDDKTGSPIAVIWGHKESVDRCDEEPPVYQFDFKSQDVTFIDLMENERSFTKNSAGKTLLPMSPFPIFIKGKPGTVQNMCNAIAAAEPVSDNVGGVDVAAFPNADASASVIFTNRVLREYKGTADVIIDGKENKWLLQIPSNGSEKEDVSLNTEIKYGKLQSFSAKYNLSDAVSGEIAGSYMILKNRADVVAGKASVTPNLLPIDLGEGVFAGIIKKGKKLIISIRVSGKIKITEDFFAGVGVYVNPFAENDTWAMPKETSGVAGELGVYEIQKSKDGGMEAFCHASQGLYAGMDPTLMCVGKVQKLIGVKTKITDDAAEMQIELPESIFAPATLDDGSRFGLNISLVKDGKIMAFVPISDYKRVGEPGKVPFVMMIMGK